MGDSAIRGRRGAPDRGPAAGGLCAGPRHVLKYVEGQRARADAADKGRTSRLLDSRPHDSLTSTKLVQNWRRTFGKSRDVDTDGFRGVAQPGSSKLDVPLTGTKVLRLSSEAHASLRAFLYCLDVLHEFWGRAALRS